MNVIAGETTPDGTGCDAGPIGDWVPATTISCDRDRRSALSIATIQAVQSPTARVAARSNDSQRLSLSKLIFPWMLNGRVCPQP